MIELRDLSKQFGGARVVDGVSLTVGAGELVVLLGSSGCGKTTTLRMVNRLVEPSSGSVWIDGQDAAAQPAPLLRRRIGYVFQRIGLFPHLTVARNIAVPLELAGWERPRARARIDELLALVELEPAMAGRMPAELSGGQQQRVGVARALAAEPALMLLDEPFGALDPLTRDRLQRSFSALRRRLALTCIFVTHDVVEALLLADRIAVMRAGRLVQVGTPRELISAPADDEVARLIDTPRRQARELSALLDGAGDG